MSLSKLQELVTNKKVHIATHWDCDGVASGALLYHLLKNHAESITTIAKGDVFEILNKDVPNDAQIIICSDIQPSLELDPNKVIYIDHHPFHHEIPLLHTIHDEHIQSCSLLIWQELLQDNNDPYLHFLALLGYFGDSGSIENIPVELHTRAMNYFPELLRMRESKWGGTFNEIMLQVSTFNTGKRMHWSGDVPLSLLKAVTRVEDIIHKRHPLSDELERYRLELRKHYNKEYDFVQTQHLQYSILNCDKNIQGVIASRYLNKKPTIVLNKRNGQVIASMRVPDDLEFDAGQFLSQTKAVIPNVVGGGHEKAGGITFDETHLDTFISYLHKNTNI